MFNMVDHRVNDINLKSNAQKKTIFLLYYFKSNLRIEQDSYQL